MSTINSNYAALSSYSTSQTVQKRTSQPSSAPPTHGPQRGGSPGDRLVQELAADGVDEETALAIKNDIENLFTEAQANGAQGPSEAFKESVDAVFAEYGLDTEEYLPAPGGPGGRKGPRGPGGPPPAAKNTESATETESESEQEDLLSIIEKLAENESDPAKLAALVVDAFYGFDQSV